LVASYWFSWLLLFANSDSTSNAATVIGPLAFTFLVGAFIRASEGINIRILGLTAVIVLVFLFAPGLSDVTKHLLQQISFPFGIDTNLNAIIYLVYLVALPFAVLFICKGLPFSVPLKHDYSYGLYVLAWPVQQSMVDRALAANVHLSPLTVFYLSTAICIPLAMLMWLYIERPIMRLKDHKFRPIPLGKANCDIVN